MTATEPWPRAPSGYRPFHARRPERVGLTGTYETMVFRLGQQRVCACSCGCDRPVANVICHAELACQRYESPNKATEGHLKVCKAAARGAFRKRKP